MLSPPPGCLATRTQPHRIFRPLVDQADSDRPSSLHMNLASCGTNQGSGDFHFLPQMEILRMDHHLLEGILLRPSYRRRGVFL